jgi:Holliday junction DNA helicase RuvB
MSTRPTRRKAAPAATEPDIEREGGRDISPVRAPEDSGEASLRPQILADFIGQEGSRRNLAVFIEAARGRGEALDHVLLHGPPGLGKTTLAQIVARELGVGFRATSGPVIQKAGDLAAILTNLQPRSSSTRSTACSPPSRRCSTLRWRISSSIW